MLNFNAGIRNLLNNEFLVDKEEIQQFFCCKNLPNLDSHSKTDPMLELHFQTLNGWRLVGQTEVIKDNLNPEFAKSMIIDFVFESTQIFKVILKDIDDHHKNTTNFEAKKNSKYEKIGEAQFAQTDLICGRDNPKSLLLKGGAVDDDNMKSGGEVLVRYEKTGRCKDFFDFQFQCENILNIEKWSKIDPFLRFYRPTQVMTNEEDGFMLDPLKIAKNKWILVHETEQVENSLNPKFKQFEISGEKFSKGDYTLPIKCELHDYQSNGSHRLIGSLYFRLCSLFEKHKEFSGKFISKDSTNVGILLLKNYKSETRLSLIEQIQLGLQINTIAAIDFTASNKSQVLDLHYMDPMGSLNQYQKAIYAVVVILAQYDHDKQIATYGFGARLGFPTLIDQNVNHCFPCSGDPYNPYGYDVQGVFECYNFALQNVRLSGPTYFGPIIEEAFQVARNQFNNDTSNLFLYIM